MLGVTADKLLAYWFVMHCPRILHGLLKSGSYVARLSLGYATAAGMAGFSTLGAQQQKPGLNHPVVPPVAQAVRRNGPIQIDGKVDEAAWNAATPVTQFTQSDPQEGKPARVRSDQESVGDFSFTRDRRALFDARPDNIFVVKMNYYLGR